MFSFACETPKTVPFYDTLLNRFAVPFDAKHSNVDMLEYPFPSKCSTANELCVRIETTFPLSILHPLTAVDSLFVEFSLHRKKRCAFSHLPIKGE